MSVLLWSHLVAQAQEKGGNAQAKEEGRVKDLVAPCTWIDLELLRKHLLEMISLKVFLKFDLGLWPCKSHFLPRTDDYLWRYICHPWVVIAVRGYFEMFLTQKDIIKC